jgi:hypothetical protein
MPSVGGIALSTPTSAYPVGSYGGEKPCRIPIPDIAPSPPRATCEHPKIRAQSVVECAQEVADAEVNLTGDFHDPIAPPAPGDPNLEAAWRPCAESPATVALDV